MPLTDAREGVSAKTVAHDPVTGVPLSEALRARPDPAAGKKLMEARQQETAEREARAEQGLPVDRKLAMRPDMPEANPDFIPYKPSKPEKIDTGVPLRIVSEFEPKGDQPTAIVELVQGVRDLERDQVLLGVTGSGKTFTMAKVIEETQRPALILAPNKTLAAQLYGEFKSFFPDNAVEYFVSYYDYYQPEAYVPRTDTYIEKEILDQRTDRPDAPFGDPGAIRAPMTSSIVASVSCIYGIGEAESYSGDDLRSIRPADAIDRTTDAALTSPSCNTGATTANFIRGTIRSARRYD